MKTCLAAIKNHHFHDEFLLNPGKQSYRYHIQTHRAPPQSISVGSKLLVEFIFHKVDEERREDENQEADVPGGYQLLQAEVKTDFQRVIMQKREFC